MSEIDDVITKLTDEESLELLSTQHFGRLVVRRADEMDIFPLNYIVHEGELVFRTAEGNKLFSLSLNHDVLFEVDNIAEDRESAWSVVVKGTARVLTSNAEIDAADELELRPWLPTLKYNYVVVTPNKISGRKFKLGQEPERY